MIIIALICFWETRLYPLQTPSWSGGPSQGSVLPWFYLLPLLLPAGGFLSWRRGPPVLKPAGWLDMPKVRPAEGLMPGLLKLKPELLSQPKTGVGCCCWVKGAAMATAAALITLENRVGLVVTRVILCHFLLKNVRGVFDECLAIENVFKIFIFQINLPLFSCRLLCFCTLFFCFSDVQSCQISQDELSLVLLFLLPAWYFPNACRV